MKDKIKADPLKPITQIQEEEVNNIMESLVDPDEREQFIRSMPKPENAQRSLYRHRAVGLRSKGGRQLISHSPLKCL